MIIDKKLNITISENDYYNEIRTLNNLKLGLIKLYSYVKQMEVQIANENKGFEFTFFGNHPNVPREFHDFLPCAFHWFGTSICNYARLVGYIVKIEQGVIQKELTNDIGVKTQIKNSCNSYLKEIEELQEVLKWRNKVGAHFALTDPRPDDNIATLEASIIYPVGFEKNRYKTNVFNLDKIEGDNLISSELPKWSLTETFEILIDRFWPDIILKQ